MIFGFPRKRPRTPAEFQAIHEHRWRARAKRALLIALLAPALVIVPLVVFLDSLAGIQYGAVAFIYLALSYAIFLLFGEPRQRRNEGEITRAVLEKSGERSHPEAHSAEDDSISIG
jgi:hypothetical protein